MVATTVGPIYKQEGREQAQMQLAVVGNALTDRFPKVVAPLEEADERILAFYSLAPENWPQIYSTSPLDRLNKELKRRNAVAMIFPNRHTVRILGALLAEQNGE